MQIEDDVDSSFGFLLSDVARLMRTRFNVIAAPEGLTQAQARVLIHLTRCEGASQKMLADILEVQPITLLRQIDRLEEAGLLERRPNPTDRRAQCLYLTDAAQPVIARLWATGEALRDDALADLSADQREQLVVMLASIKGRLASGTEDSGATATTGTDRPGAATTEPRRAGR